MRGHHIIGGWRLWNLGMPATSLSIPLASPHDLFAKLKRDAALLIEDRVSSGRFFNFVITGYSFIDWVKVDPAFARVLPQALSWQ